MQNCQPGVQWERMKKILVCQHDPWKRQSSCVPKAENEKKEPVWWSLSPKDRRGQAVQWKMLF